MKKLILSSFIAMSTLTANASIFDDKIEQTELATALIHCSSATGNLLVAHDYISNITAKFAKVSEGVTSKTYKIETRSPRGFGRSEAAETLTIKLTVTQPPKGAMDMPSRLDYKCSVK